MKHFCPNVPIILVGNKKDLRNDEHTRRELAKMKQAGSFLSVLTINEVCVICTQNSKWASAACCQHPMGCITNTYSWQGPESIHYLELSACFSHWWFKKIIILFSLQAMKTAFLGAVVLLTGSCSMLGELDLWGRNDLMQRVSTSNARILQLIFILYDQVV